MKSFIGILVMMLSLNLWASNYKIKSIWKNSDAPAGKTYIASVTNTDYDSDAGDWIVVFGTKNGKAVKRAFSLGGMSFYTYDGASNTGKDDFYKMVYHVKGESIKTLSLSLTPIRNFGKSYQIDYQQYESVGSKRFAKKMVEQVLAEKDELRDLSELKTISQFKRRIELVNWDFGFGGFYDNNTFPFPTYDLQIEWYFNSTPSSKKLSQTTIRQDGKDILSQKFKEGETWEQDADDALAAVEEDIEAGLNTDDWDYEVGTYSAFTKKATKFEDAVLAKAAKKFVQYEITNATGFECEDGIYTWESITWILVDGSTYTYSPGTECD